MIIYKTTNNINGKIYVGQNSNTDPKYFGSGYLISLAIKKYGKENFTKETLEICDNKKLLNEREIFWIKQLDSTNKDIGYNISFGGTGGKLIDVEVKKGKTYEEYYGVEKSKEIKQKLSDSHNQKRNYGFVNTTSEEVGKKISETLKNKKIIRTDEYKRKVSDGVRLFFETDKGKAAKEKIRLTQKGLQKSDETKEKISQAMKGKKPKQLEVHPSTKYWYFYDHENTLVYSILGNRTQFLKEIKTNQRRIVIFKNLDECLSYKLPTNKDFKLFYKKYYNG